jgi:PAS domain-containing protein
VTLQLRFGETAGVGAQNISLSPLSLPRTRSLISSSLLPLLSLSLFPSALPRSLSLSFFSLSLLARRRSSATSSSPRPPRPPLGSRSGEQARRRARSSAFSLCSLPRNSVPEGPERELADAPALVVVPDHDLVGRVLGAGPAADQGQDVAVEEHLHGTDAAAAAGDPAAVEVKVKVAAEDLPEGVTVVDPEAAVGADGEAAGVLVERHFERRERRGNGRVRGGETRVRVLYGRRAGGKGIGAGGGDLRWLGPQIREVGRAVEGGEGADGGGEG